VLSAHGASRPAGPTRVRQEGLEAPTGRNCDRTAQAAATMQDGEVPHALAILRQLGIESISLAPLPVAGLFPRYEGRGAEAAVRWVSRKAAHRGHTSTCCRRS
jgi:hypothetical protein